jgi:nicotinate phosphoribosyltransferase
MDEHRLRELLAAGAPIDGFGVGTSLVTSSDAPFLDAVYKLQEYAGRPRRKLSSGKATWPGRKQVFRDVIGNGRFRHDVVSLEGDPQPGEPLLIPVMKNGRRLAAPEDLGMVRRRAASQLTKLPDSLAVLDKAPEPYRVEIAQAVRELADQVDQQRARCEASP